MHGERKGHPLTFVDGHPLRSSGNTFPRLIRRKHQNGGKKLTVTTYDEVQNRLCGASLTGIVTIGIKPILDQIVIDGGEFYRGKLSEFLIHQMKLMAIVSLAHIALQFGPGIQHPAVHRGE